MPNSTLLTGLLPKPYGNATLLANPGTFWTLFVVTDILQGFAHPKLPLLPKNLRNVA
jgi:hypothetical protein